MLRCSTISRFYLSVALLYFWEEMKVPLVNYRVWGETTAIPEVFSAPVIIVIIPVIIPIPQQIFSQNIQHSSHSPAYFMTTLLKIQSLINAFCLAGELFLFFTSSRNVNSFKSRDREKFLHLNIVSSPVFYLLPLVQMQLQIYTGELNKKFCWLSRSHFFRNSVLLLHFIWNYYEAQKMCNPLPGT